MNDERCVAYGELRGYLSAFSAINDQKDLAYVFEFSVLEKYGDLHHSLMNFFADQVDDIRAEPVSNWEEKIGTVFAHRIFGFLAGPDGSPYCQLLDMHHRFSLSSDSRRSSLTGRLIELIRIAADPKLVWELFLVPDDAIGGVWEGFAFEASESIFVLQLLCTD